MKSQNACLVESALALVAVARASKDRTARTVAHQRLYVATDALCRSWHSLPLESCLMVDDYCNAALPAITHDDADVLDVALRYISLTRKA